MTIYFYEFSDLDREPITFNCKEDFEKFCVEHQIYAYLLGYFEAFSETVVATCLHGTNICVITRCYNWEDKRKTLQRHIEYILNKNKEWVEFAKSISTDKNSYFFELPFGPVKSYIAIAQGNIYEIWVSVPIRSPKWQKVEDTNLCGYEVKYVGNKFLLSIESVNKLELSYTNFNEIFSNLIVK